MDGGRLAALLVLVIALCIVAWLVWRGRSITPHGTCLTEKCRSGQNVLLGLHYRLQALVDTYGGEPKEIELKEHAESSFAWKKSTIYLAIRRKDGSFYDDNTLMFVGTHELAHCLMDEDTRHHPPEYQTFFATLLRKAADLGFYNPKIPFDRSYPQRG